MCPFEQSKNRNPKGPARAGPFGLFVDFYGPTVVAQVDVGRHLVWIDDHLLDLLTSFVEVIPSVSTLPNFHGQLYPFGGIVHIGDFKGNWHREISFIHEADDLIFSIGLHGTDAEVNVAIAIKPTLPEPGQVLAGHILHVIEEVSRLRVFESPGLDVGAEGIVKALWAQDVFAEHHQANSWLHVGHHPEVARVGDVWIVIYSFTAVAGEVAIEIAGLLQGRRVFSLIEGVGTVVEPSSIQA